MSADDSFSPLITLRQKYNLKGKERTQSTSIQPKRDIAPKLSLKSKTNATPENLVMTPTCNNSLNNTLTCRKLKPLSASFLFSSCKKKLHEDSFLESIPPILVADSSEEECCDSDDSFILENGVKNFESELVHESLEEYSLIRKWLQNSETPNSSTSSDNDSQVFHGNKLIKESEWDTEIDQIKNPVNLNSMQKQEEIIVLSSDEEDEQYESYLQNILKKTTEGNNDVGTQSNNLFDTDSPLVFKDVSNKKAGYDTKRNTVPNSINLLSPSKKEEILSSEEEDDQFEIYLQNISKKLQEKKHVPGKDPLVSSFINDESLSDDSYDTPSVFESLQYKLRTPVELSIDSDLPVRSRGRKAKKTCSETEKENAFRSPKNLTLKCKPKVQQDHHNRRVSDDDDSDLEDIFGNLTINDIPTGTKPKKLSQVTTESFLASLSVDLPEKHRHSDAVPYIKSFRKLRTDLTHKLFKLFNEAVFQNQLPQDFSLTWNKRLTRTAGFCRHFTRRENGAITYESRIELSVKVVDTPCRLRDTLIHEMCHAATWMIDNCRAGHGPVWKKYARLVHRVFPELPIVTRCHNYEITYKFYYNCCRCSFSTGRHSKSIDTTTHVCPYCRGALQLSSEAKTKENEPKTSAVTPKTRRTPNAFALFVKANFAVTKSSRPDLSHGAIMKILSSKFAESKKQVIQGTG